MHFLRRHNIQLSCVALSWHAFVLLPYQQYITNTARTVTFKSNQLLKTVAQTMTIATSAPIAGYTAITSFSLVPVLNPNSYQFLILLSHG